jgi:hypothetical protein
MWRIFFQKKEKENPKSAQKRERERERERERICDKIFCLCKFFSNKNKNDWHILKTKLIN